MIGPMRLPLIIWMARPLTHPARLSLAFHVVLVNLPFGIVTALTASAIIGTKP